MLRGCAIICQVISLHTLGGFYKIDEKNVILAGFRYYNYPKLGVLETGGESIRPKELAARWVMLVS